LALKNPFCLNFNIWKIFEILQGSSSDFFGGPENINKDLKKRRGNINGLVAN
jgi:hypothetical protein